MKRFLFRLLLFAPLASLATPALAQDRAAVLDSIQYASFRFFWNYANPANGLCPDRSATGSVCSTASTGFGLSCICVGIDHGWITREQGRQRVLTTLQTFWNLPQGPGTSSVIGYKGLYYHWLDMNTGMRRVDWNSELSTIDTALLFAGIMHTRRYFDDPFHPDEITIRALADSITRRADWRWVHLGRYLETGNPNDSLGIQMGWNPTTGFSTFGKWTGYNEAMIMYVMAIGSPTHPAPTTDWNVWTGTYQFSTAYASVGSYVRFAPLFGHQYSHCWIDFRNNQDAYMRGRDMTYFENSRRATLSQIAYGRQYGQFEPILHFGYSDTLWGWTACDGPSGSGTYGGYYARGAPNGADDGTIAPTAAISSYVFAPDSVWPCIRNMWNLRNSGWAPVWLPAVGFTDAFNPEKHPWIGWDAIGIDQGPQVLMIENELTGSVWTRFMQHPDIQNGLALAGFTPVVAVEPPLPSTDTETFLAAAPNPFRGSTTISFRLAAQGPVRLALFDLQGRRIFTLVDADRPAGEHHVPLSSAGLRPGVYLYRLETTGSSVVRRAVVLQ